MLTPWIGGNMECGRPCSFTSTSFHPLPDSHVIRKHGTEIAKAVRGEAREIRSNVVKTNSEIARQEMLLAFDRRLKARDINPGTSADLTVATLFVTKLNFILHNRRVNG